MSFTGWEGNTASGSAGEELNVRPSHRSVARRAAQGEALALFLRRLLVYLSNAPGRFLQRAQGEEVRLRRR